MAAAVHFGIATPEALARSRALPVLEHNDIKLDRRLTCVGEV